MTDTINLSWLNMKHFTVSDAELHCKLSKINPNNITHLYLHKNKLKDISGVSIFKNLEELDLGNNKITDINPLKNLYNLRNLNIENLNLTDELDAVKILKSLPNLKYLYCENTFKTINIRKKLRGKGIGIYE